MQKTKNILFYVLVIAALPAFGFYRDFVFKHINALLQARDHEIGYTMPPSLRFIAAYDYDTIVNIKWLLTFIFSGIYLVIALLLVKRLFHKRLFSRITLFTYIAITLVSGLFILTGMLFPHTSQKMYEFARYLMGMAQSPLVLMLLIPAFLLAEKEKSGAKE